MARFDIQIIKILHVAFSLGRGEGYRMMDNLYIFADVVCMEVKEYNLKQSPCPRIAEGNVQSTYCQWAAQRINELL